MALYTVKPAFQRTLRPLAAGLIRGHVHPDLLTAAALGLSIGAGAMLRFADRLPPPALLGIAGVALARTALNALDGMVARGSGKARPWGGVLNEMGDRLADVAIFGGLALAPFVSRPLALAALAAMLLASHAGVLGQAAGAGRSYRGVLGKPDRMLALGFAVAGSALTGETWPLNALLAVVAGGGVITLIQRLEAVRGSLHS